MRLLRNKFYYTVKPWVAPRVRLALRQWYSRRRRVRAVKTWPILQGSEVPPPNWPGWPNHKQFAVVLTHDVEGPKGLSRCTQLMELERDLGFRSSFNFIPEGPYQVPEALRENLRRNGYEVGVHDLHHDGKLYSSYQAFSQKAHRINRYLSEWGAVGFRSGFMLHNLDWAHQLNILYEASTFDTDPFEPQPDGVGTVFPFWVPPPQLGEPRQGRSNSVSFSGSSRGFVGLPYTLVQDSTLFLLLSECKPDIWFQKVDWLAKMGGMVLIDTHPDFKAMNGVKPSSWEYPVVHYRQLLEYIRSKYAGAYWQVTAAELAAWYKSTLFPESERLELSREVTAPVCPGSARDTAPPENFEQVARPISPAHPGKAVQHPDRKPKIWIDLDNTPHVPFFEPILDELRSRGFPVLLTARDAFQVCELADKKGMQYIRVGRHYGKHMLLKGAGLLYRSVQLAPVVFRERPVLGVSHGARSQLLLGSFLHIPTLLIQDYEYCQFAPMATPTWLMAPSVIPDAALLHGKARILKYPGIKEDVYAWNLKPDPRAIGALGLRDSDLVVTVRPPATEAHYHNPESEGLFSEVMARACQTPELRIILLPRNRRQGESLRKRYPEWFKDNKTVIPGAALDGMNLIWHSDLVVSGGGTMNREAAALGVPVYSIFRGHIGAVDRNLQAQGRLVLLESIEDVHQKLKLVRKPRSSVEEVTSRSTLRFIVDTIQELAEAALRDKA